MSKKYYFYTFLIAFFCFGSVAEVLAQTTVKGTVLDEENNSLPFANIVIKGTTEGVTSDLDGNFSLTTEKAPPFTLVIGYVGMADKEMEVSSSSENNKIKLGAASMMETVVIGASRVPENIMQSPVTIEKLDAIAIQQTANTDYYDGITKLKGVSSTSGSLTFTSLNTRGFATAANTRFVQLMDGMDNAAPLLNFPTGNIVGIGEMDIANVELVPGAASALYGPNAFNGILLMNSKNPFEHQGLSFQMKLGGTYSNASNQVEPLASYSARYAKALNDKFAFKLNLSFLAAKDWQANDYTTDRNLYEAESRAALDNETYTGTGAEANVGNPNFDGMNTYGDETQIVYPFTHPTITPQIAEVLIQQCVNEGLPESVCRAIVENNIYRLGTLDLRRTGFKEEDLVDNNNAKSLKGDVALHYRLTPKTELIANYRYGSGASVYQGSERYALRDFTQQFLKLEAKGESFMLRGYVSQTNDGDSYNLTALGATMNEIFAPSSDVWVPNYLGNYAGALIFGPILGGTTPEDLTDEQRAMAHQAARGAADAAIPAVGSDKFNSTLETVRNGLFQKGGAGFIDNSRMYHGEGNYNFTKLFNDKISVLVGGNYRMYDLYTEGTIFNEDPDGDGIFERIKIGEWGVYTQISKTLIDDRLKLTGSVRYDKNQNFEGQFSPRISVVTTLGENRDHNIRASYQTGFRNPDTQTQYIWFPTTNILIGGTRDNAERYGIYEGGAYTQASYDDFVASLVAGAPDSSLLEEIYLEYIQPEQLTAMELGYKSNIGKKLFIDINGYYNLYRNFIAQLNVVNKEPTEHRGEPLLPGTSFRPYSNTGAKISSWGAGIGLNYALPKKYVIGGSYSFADYTVEEETAFDVGFNTPKHSFVINFANREIVKNLGFALAYKWQDSFFWENAFAIGNIESYGTLDAQLNYNWKKAKTQIKVGASNIIGPDYQTNVGGPYVGRQFFISLTFNDLMNMGSRKE